MPDIAGLKLIVPTSVAGSGVSVSASGKVTFTAATTVSVNGCFTSSYDNYLIVVRGKSSSLGTMQFRYRLSGTDASGSNYTDQLLSADSTTVSGSRGTSQTYNTVGYWETVENGLHCYIYGPGLAQPTALRTVSAFGYLNAWISDRAGTHSVSTAYDGFTLYPSANNITGALCVYGLSQ